MPWLQVYDPFHAIWLSVLFAALPVMVLLVAPGPLHLRAHWAAALGLEAALLVALAVYGMPVSMAGMAAAYGALYGLAPIGWTVVNVCFFCRLIADKGRFAPAGGRAGTIARDCGCKSCWWPSVSGPSWKGPPARLPPWPSVRPS